MFFVLIVSVSGTQLSGQKRQFDINMWVDSKARVLVPD